MFKKIVVAIAFIKTQEDFDTVCGNIEIAFQREKITWNERQILFALVCRIEVKD